MRLNALESSGMRSTAGLQPLAAADLGEKAAETLARVREWKQAMKKQGKTKAD